MFLFVFVVSICTICCQIMKMFSGFAGAFSICMCFLKLQRVRALSATVGLGVYMLGTIGSIGKNVNIDNFTMVTNHSELFQIVCFGNLFEF